MITSLRIENFALIDEVDIRFNAGFTVITGETGSGKSILLNALSLILGERANFSVIGDKKDKSIVEAEIDVAEFNLEPFFVENELDYFERCIIRREITKQGRSRAFINDIPVQLQTLRNLSSQLVHIHSQYNTLELKEVSFQLEVLDILSGNQVNKKQFSGNFQEYQKDKKRLTELKQKLSAAASMADYNQFQLKELDELRLGEINYDKIQGELLTAENADDLKACYAELSEGLSAEGGVIDVIGTLKTSMAKNAGIDKTLKELHDRLESVLIEIQDLAAESENKLEGIEIDPAKLLELSEHMNAYNKAIQKHNAKTQEDLVKYWKELQSTALNDDDLQSEVEGLEAAILKQENELLTSANSLHKQREKSVPGIEIALKDALQSLKLVDTELVFKLTRLDQLTESGLSKLEIFFSPNAGIEPVPVHKAASGGELSRVMLALQSLIAAKTKLRTIFFDEIDTGVSGDVAQKVGNTLMKMGQGMQVIAITHLPQVAAKGGQHLKVTKSVVDGTTKSYVTELNMEERIEETARLMSGDEINEAALENAKALMS
ncbi:MAG: DNA repair protein RecN (Recombination protein N) [Crocinitomicaceae bacterium]|jgi:DNA repair protein RecN (Recombination protein N)